PSRFARSDDSSWVATVTGRNESAARLVESRRAVRVLGRQIQVGPEGCQLRATPDATQPREAARAPPSSVRKAPWRLRRRGQRDSAADERRACAPGGPSRRAGG